VPELWLPGVVKKPIPQGANDPLIIPVGDVFHIAVSEAASLHDFFERSGGIESTGYIRRDGTIEQYRPLNVECDAQGDGNSWVRDGKRYGLNSWETQGMGEGEWTPQQIASIKFIIGWKHRNYGTPLRLNPGPNASGFGYHRMFKQWNKNAHSCPGSDRVQQFHGVIVPWMKEQAHPAKTPNITAILRAKTREARIAAAQKVASRGSSEAKAAAHDLLSAMTALHRAEQARDAALAALRKLERK